MSKGITFSGSNTPCFAKFTQCGGALVVTLDTGFKVFNVDPITAITTVKVDVGGVKLVEPLFRTNVYAFVPTGGTREYPATSLYFYDTFQHKIVNFLAFGKNIHNVCLSKDIVVVHLKDCVKIYNIADLMFLDEIDIPVGTSTPSCLAVSSQQASPLVACSVDKKVNLLWVNSRRRISGEIKLPYSITDLSMWNSSHILITMSHFSVVYDVQNVSNPKALLIVKHPQLSNDVSSVFNSSYIIICNEGAVYVYYLDINGDYEQYETVGFGRIDEGKVGAHDDLEDIIPKSFLGLKCISPGSVYYPKIGKNCICSLFTGGVSLVYDKKIMVRLQLGSKNVKIIGRINLDKHVLK